MVRDEIDKLDPTLAVLGVQTIDQFRARLLDIPDLLETLLTSLGVLVLTLGSVGLYGVISFSVAQRHREIAIRIALGADFGDVVGMMMRQSAGVVVLGGILGLAVVTLMRFMTMLLYGISPTDPATIAVVYNLVDGPTARDARAFST
jgi:putative ABC transport system permease protein